MTTSTYFDIREFTWGAQYHFECNGCMTTHMFVVAGDGRKPSWEFNGDIWVAPTFTPELRIHRKCNKRGKIIVKRCLLKLIDGMIIYSVNCDHMLAGRTVPMVPWFGFKHNYADTSKCRRT